MAVSAALLDEADHPIHAVRGGGSARGSKNVTLICERPDIRIPSRNSIGDRGVTLGYFVNLVETVCAGGIPSHGVLDESVDIGLVGIPEHDADGKTTVHDQVRDCCVPKMDYYGTPGREN